MSPEVIPSKIASWRNTYCACGEEKRGEGEEGGRERRKGRGGKGGEEGKGGKERVESGKRESSRNKEEGWKKGGEEKEENLGTQEILPIT